MAIFWKDEYATGEDLIDRQHQVLFEYLNTFEKQIKKGMTEEEIEETLQFLGRYSLSHFNYEEDCMDRHKCPILARNKEAHKRFLMAFDSLKNRYVDEGTNEMLLETIHSTLETWIVNHICDIDHHLRACLKATA